MSAEERQFRRICKTIEGWPDGCPDDAELDLLLRAAKEAFREGSLVCDGLRLLYVRQAMLRPVVDMLCHCFSEQFCQRYRGGK
jgi:hypothetical protein